MKVILTKDVETLGESGDVLSVADGYARNYLLPKHFAIQATKGALEDRETRIERIRQKAEKKNQEDQARAEKITAIGSFKIEANAGNNGKLFGAITTKEIARILFEKSGLEIERKNISVNAPMNRVGDYTVAVKFSSKVTATVAVEIAAILTGPEAEAGFYNEPQPVSGEEIAYEEVSYEEETEA